MSLLDNRYFQIAVQSGVFILLATGIAYVVGYKFQEGIYTEYGIYGIKPNVTPSVYVDFLGKIGILTASILLLSGFKDNIIRYLDQDKKQRKKRWLAFAIILPVLALILFWLTAYFFGERNASQATRETWNTYGAYIVLFCLTGFLFYSLSIGFRSNFIRRPAGVKKEIQLIHYFIEGAYLFILAIAGFLLMAAISTHMGSQSIYGSRYFAVAHHSDNEAYLVVQDEGNKLLAVQLCSIDPLKIKKGNFIFVDRTAVPRFEGINSPLKKDSFC